MDAYTGPPIRDVFEPTGDEIRAWAYSDAQWPEQDWDVFMAEPEHLQLLVQLITDPACHRDRARKALLSSLYCTVGHTDHADPRIAAAIEVANCSAHPWLTTWARRARHVLEYPADFKSNDWCGFGVFTAQLVEQ